MDSQTFLTENKIPFRSSKENVSQESDPSKIHKNEPYSKENRLDQSKEPLLDQSKQSPSAADLKLEESKTILKKVKDIDKKFEEGWINVYDFWLSVIIAEAALKGMLLATSVKDWVERREYEWIKVFAIPLGLAFFSLFCLVRLALLHKEALKKKDPKKAAQAYISLVKTVIYSFSLSVIFFLMVISGRYYYSGYREAESDWIRELYDVLYQFMKYYVIPAGISIYGSYKVKVVLEERMNLLSKVPNKMKTHLIHNCEPSSKEDNPHQMKKTRLGQSVPIPSKIDPKLKESAITLKDIDRRLSEGWFFAYELWLYIIIVLAPSKGMFMCAWMSGVFYLTREGDQTWIIAFSILLIFALYYIYWAVREALLHKDALKKKDPKIAAQAYTSLVKLSIHYLVLCVIFFIVGTYFGYYSFKFTDSWKDFFLDIGYPVVQFISHYAIPVPISLYGSYQLKSLLEERKMLIEEADIPQQSAPFDSLSKKLEEFNGGWLFLVYKVWLYLTPVLGIYFYGNLYKSREVSYDRLWDEEEDRLSIFYWVPWIYALHCVFWLVRQAWLQVIAMKQKNLKLATQAYNSIVWLVRYYSIWVFLKFLNFTIALWLSPEGEAKYEVRLLISFLVRLIEVYLIPMGICIYGSKKVKNLLEEKEKSIRDTHSVDDENDDSSESKI